MLNYITKYKGLTFAQKAKYVLLISFTLFTTFLVIQEVAHFTTIQERTLTRHERTLQHTADLSAIVINKSENPKNIADVIDLLEKQKSWKNIIIKLRDSSKKYTGELTPYLPDSKVISAPLSFDGKNFGTLEVTYDFSYKRTWMYKYLGKKSSFIILFLAFIFFLFHRFIRKSLTIPLQVLLSMIKTQKVNASKFRKRYGDPLLNEIVDNFDALVSKVNDEKQTILEANKFQKNLLDTVDAGILVCKENGEIIQFNRGAMLVLESDQLIGKNVQGIFPFLVSPYSKSLTGIEGEAILYDKRVVPVSIRLRPFKRDRDSYCMISIRNQKRIKEQLSRINVLKQRFNATAESASVGIWEWDFIDGTQYWSHKVYEIMGIDTKVSPSFDLIASIVHPDDLHILSAHTKPSEPSASSFHLEYRILKNDEWRWVQSSGKIFINEVNQVVRMAGSISDITELKQRETLIDSIEKIQKLWISKKSKNTLIQDILKIIIDVSHITNARICFQNGPHFEDHKTPRCFLTFKVIDVLTMLRKRRHPRRPYVNPKYEDVSSFIYSEFDTHKLAFIPLMYRNEVFGFIKFWKEKGFNSKDDLEPFFLLFSLVEKIISRIIDDDKIIAIKKEVFEAQQRFESIAKGTSDGIWDWNLKTNDLWYSDKWGLMFGYQPHEIEHDITTWENLIFKEDRDKTLKLADKFIKGEINNFELRQRYKHKNGSTVHVLCRALLVKDAIGGVTHFLGTHTDITEFIQAQEKIEAANQAKKDFLANMSHEIRTPMNAVLGMADALDHTKLNKTQKDYLHTITNSGKHLLALINDILDLSKIEAGKLTIHKEEHDFANIIKNSITLFSTQAKEKKLKLLFKQKNKALPMVLCDANRISQVINNFISNAIKFTDKGSVTVDLDTFEFKNKMYINVRVKDTGIGIEQKDIHKLFHAFNQADSSATREYEGTGLGLAICKKIIEMIGGTVGIQSKYKKGTMVWFTCALDIAQMIHTKTKKPILQKSTPNQKLTAISKARILVVEDNKVNQRVIKLMLASFNAQVTIVGDGQAAVDEALSGTPYDLIFMDIQLPILDGINAIKMIQQSPRENAKTPIVLLTAHALDEQRERYQSQVNTCGYLTKPIDKNTLKSILEKLFTLDE